jgi:predicted dehydrogenase
MRTIKAGLIGTGFIGPAHLEAVRRLGFVEVVALAERDQATADQKAALLGVPRAYGDYRALLADPEIEVVHNCTPNNLHFEINTALLEAGKHCVSEKPLAMTSQESRALVALAAKTGLVNAVDFNYRFYPLVQHAKAMCDDGDVGEVYAIHGSYLQDWLYLDTDYNWRLEPEVSGESRAVADIGSHWCDLVQFITGRTITEVYGDLVTVHKTRKKPKGPIETYAGKLLQPEDYQPVPIGTEDYATVLFVLDNGAHGAFTVCQVAAGRKNRLYYEIDGGKCALSWDQEHPNDLWVGYREKANEVVVKDPSLLKDAARPYAHYPGGHPEGYPDGPKNLFRNVYLKVAGDASALPFSTFADGHREVVICEAILQSHRARQWTKVQY